MRHRGQHPRDSDLFARKRWPTLRTAVAELSWLLSRGYSERASLKLVGDRHGLTARQRKVVGRGACSDEALEARTRRRVELAALREAPLAIDGFNVLITAESLLSGGFVFRGRDGAHRDLASVHGSYRMVEETGGAIDRVAALLGAAGVGPVTWYLDRPVSNSGRLRARLLEAAAAAGRPWEVLLVDNPDRALVERGLPAATCDAWILDHCAAWVDLIAALIRALLEGPGRGDAPMPDLWLVNLTAGDGPAVGEDP